MIFFDFNLSLKISQKFCFNNLEYPREPLNSSAATQKNLDTILNIWYKKIRVLAALILPDSLDREPSQPVGCIVFCMLLIDQTVQSNYKLVAGIKMGKYTESPNFPSAILTVCRQELNASQLEVIEGNLPEDLQGHLFLTSYFYSEL